MKRLIMVLFVIAVTDCYAQNHFIGFKIGAGFTNTTGDFISSTVNRTGISTGVSYQYMFSNHFSLGADVLYSQRGYRGEYLELQTGPTERNRYNYNYLAIPIRVSYASNSKLYGLVSAGLVPAFLIKAQVVYPQQVGNAPRDLTDVSNFDIAGLVELGIGYKISEHCYVFTSLSAQLSFNTFTTERYFYDAKGRHYGFTLEAGVKYALSAN